MRIPPAKWAWIILFLILSIFVLSITSCSIEKKQAIKHKKMLKAIEKYRADSLALEIAKTRPDLFKQTIIPIDTFAKGNIDITTPVINEDTTSDKIGDIPCDFEYQDEKIKFTKKGNEIHYKTKPQVVKVFVKIPFKVYVPCPPCPGENLILIAQKDADKKVFIANEKTKKVEYALEKEKSKKQEWMFYFFVILILNIIWIFLKYILPRIVKGGL